MAELVRAIILAGLLSGTQPVTIMGLLLLMTGDRGARNGWAFLAGAFVVESTLLLTATIFLGDTVDPPSTPGRVLLSIRILGGVALILFGLMLRRPPRKPQPAVPKALESLQSMGPGKAFVAGLILADYQGPVLGSLAVAASPVELRSRLPVLVLYTLIATGIPALILVMTERSERAHTRLTGASDWVMENRRGLTSWISLLLGLFLVGDAAFALAAS